MTLCRTRGQGMTGPANLRRGDIKDAFVTDGWEANGMPWREFLDWMLQLDAAYIAWVKDNAPEGDDDE